MRVRTAIAIATTIVLAQGAITWVAFQALLTIPHRNWAVNTWRWHIELGPLAAWLAAGGAIFASIVALGIATADRRERRRERRDAERAQARLVVVTVTIQTDYLDQQPPSFIVNCDNRGAQPILDVKLAAAKMQAHPGSIAELGNWTNDLLTVNGHTLFGVDFVTQNGDALPPRLQTPTRSGNYPDLDSLQIVGWVAFSDAYGNRWARSSDGGLKRLTRDSQLGDLVYPYEIRERTPSQ